MQSSKEQQREIRKPFSAINVKKKGKQENGEDLFKKIRDTKGTFHAKMGSIKDRNDKDLHMQNRLRRGGKNNQNCTKKS